MARLPARGAAVAAPCRDESELRGILSDLHIGHFFDVADIPDLYLKLGTVIGQWMAEQYGLEVSPVARTLLSMTNNLNEVAAFLSGLQTGMHSELEIAVASHVIEYLAIDPTVGSYEKAREFVSAFQQQAARMAHVCLVARAGLPDRPGERGRPALDWYHDFTALLLELAKKGHLKPTLRKDRITGARSGWLFEAAQALESFLYPEMRSPSPEACFKRLERSLKRLRDRKRQKTRDRP
jgi:hypothetical protein